MAAPKLGEDGMVSEAHPLPEDLLPVDVGIRKQPVVYSCLDASLYYLVVGSMQGYVFVVDLKSKSLLKKFSEFKGTAAITAVKLNPVKDCVAYTTDNGFIRVERVTRTVSTKWRVQEKNHAPATSLEWSPGGDHLYIGFTTGRVIQFHLQYPDGAFSPVPLPENYGSRIVQLSASNQALLVSTEERTLLVDIKSHKLDQVGRKDRKTGRYGGFFVQDGSRAYVARPGLRLWVAGNFGKVSHTVAFKESLSTGHLPVVHIKTFTSLLSHFSKSWQFSFLRPWIYDRFILTCHDNTLFVLDPEEGTIVGVLTLQYSISDLATAGRHLFILYQTGSSRAVVKLSIHPSLIKLKASPFMKLVGNLSAASSRSGSREALDQLHTEKSSKVHVSPKKEIMASSDQGEVEPRVKEIFKPLEEADGAESEKPIELVDLKVTPVVDGTVEEEGGGSVKMERVCESAAAGLEKEESKEQSSRVGRLAETRVDDVYTETETSPAVVETVTKQNKEREKQVIDTPTRSADVGSLSPEPTTVTSNESGKYNQAEIQSSPKKELEPEKDSDSIPEHTRGKLNIPALALVHGLSHVKADLKEIKGALKLGKLTEFISQAAYISPTLQKKEEHISYTVGSNEVVRLPGDPPSGDKEDKATPIVAATPIDPEEQRRRLRMVVMVEQDEDVVVATKSPSKTKKTRKRKTRKTSKHSSAASSKSVSMEQLYEPGYDDEASRDNDISKLKEVVPLPSLVLSEQQEAELSALEQVQIKELTPPTEVEKQEDDVIEESRASGQIDRREPEVKTERVKDEVEEEAKADKRKRDDETVKVVELVVKEQEKVVAESTVLPANDSPTNVVTLAEKTAPSAILDYRIEQESGQEMMEEDVDGAMEEPQKEEKEQLSEEKFEPHLLERDTKQEVGGDFDTAPTVHPKKKEQSNYKPLFDEPSDQEDNLFGSSDSPLPYHNIGSIVHSRERDPNSPYYSDPLYQDSDSEEQKYGSSSYGTTGREWLEEAREFGHARRDDFDDYGGKGPFLSLQPAAIDPLRSDEYDDLSRSPAPYEATPSLDHTLAHTRYSSSPEQPQRMQPLSLPCSSDMLMTGASPPKFTKTAVTSPVLSKFTARRDVGHEEDKFEGSESSHESDNEAVPGDSQVVTDWYQLCGGLVQDSRKVLEQRPHVETLPPPPSSPPEDETSFEPIRRRRIERVEKSLDEEEESSPNADIWVPIPHPSRHNLQSICLSEKLLWVVDTRWNVYCTTMESRGRDWHNIKRKMSQISSSPSGNNVWAIYRHNAYVRLGIGMNPEGSQWRNLTKNTHLAHKIKQVAVDENAVWAIGTDGKVLFRKDVGEATPEGKVWQEVTHGSSGFSVITCCQGIVWAITTSGKVFCRVGITPSMPSGRKWAEVKTPKFVSISITTGGVVWGVSQDNSIGFRCGVSMGRPSGKGPWWEVCINALNNASSPFSPLWHVMSPDGNSILTSVSSFVTTNLPTLPGLPGHGVNKVLSISASSKSGVVVLETGSRLHACWRSTTGFHYSPACKGDIFQFMSWSKLAAGGSALWLVRSDNGDLYSLAFAESLKRIECPAKVDLLAASPSCMWIVSKDSIWSRQALTTDIPEGISFDYIELSIQLHEAKLRNVACGKRSVWAVDGSGVPHFRFGVHSREPGTGMSPAWVPVEDNPHPFLKIAVSPDDWLVWACDMNYNVYVRTGVTADFPVGRKWELIPGEHVKELCASNEKVYALSQSGELLCRYGITESNVQGNYWRKMPGKYEHITVGEFGDLWTMDSKGQVWKQEWKVITVGSQLVQGKEDLEEDVIVDQSEWEML